MGLRTGCCRGGAGRSARSPTCSRSATWSASGLNILLVCALPGLPAALQAPPHRDRVLQRRVPEAGATGRAARHGPRGRDGPVRGQDHRGPVLEGPARRLHVHRVRTLSGRLPGVGDRQAARPQDAHHGHPGHGRRGRAGSAAPAVHPGRDRPAGLDQAALDRPIVGTAIPYDAVWDCVTCGACVEACPVVIEHVDKIVGLAPEPGAGGEPVPGRAQRRLHGHGAPRRPVGRAGIGAPGLDEGTAVRGAHGGAGRSARVRTPSRTWSASTGSAARQRSTSAIDAWRARS